MPLIDYEKTAKYLLALTLTVTALIQVVLLIPVIFPQVEITQTNFPLFAERNISLDNSETILVSGSGPELDPGDGGGSCPNQCNPGGGCQPDGRECVYFSRYCSPTGVYRSCNYSGGGPSIDPGEEPNPPAPEPPPEPEGCNRTTNWQDQGCGQGCSDGEMSQQRIIDVNGQCVRDRRCLPKQICETEDAPISPTPPGDDETPPPNDDENNDPNTCNRTTNWIDQGCGQGMGADGNACDDTEMAQQRIKNDNGQCIRDRRCVDSPICDTDDAPISTPTPTPTPDVCEDTSDWSFVGCGNSNNQCPEGTSLENRTVDNEGQCAQESRCIAQPDQCGSSINSCNIRGETEITPLDDNTVLVCECIGRGKYECTTQPASAITDDTQETSPSSGSQNSQNFADDDELCVGDNCLDEGDIDDTPYCSAGGGQRVRLGNRALVNKAYRECVKSEKGFLELVISQCIPGFYRSGDVCLPKLSDEQRCDRSDQCLGGICTQVSERGGRKLCISPQSSIYDCQNGLCKKSSCVLPYSEESITSGEYRFVSPNLYYCETGSLKLVIKCINSEVGIPSTPGEGVCVDRETANKVSSLPSNVYLKPEGYQCEFVDSYSHRHKSTQNPNITLRPRGLCCNGFNPKETSYSAAPLAYETCCMNFNFNDPNPSECTVADIDNNRTNFPAQVKDELERRVQNIGISFEDRYSHRRNPQGWQAVGCVFNNGNEMNLIYSNGIRTTRGEKIPGKCCNQYDPLNNGLTDTQKNEFNAICCIRENNEGQCVEIDKDAVAPKAFSQTNSSNRGITLPDGCSFISVGCGVSSTGYLLDRAGVNVEIDELIGEYEIVCNDDNSNTTEESAGGIQYGTTWSAHNEVFDANNINSSPLLTKEIDFEGNIQPLTAADVDLISTDINKNKNSLVVRVQYQDDFGDNINHWTTFVGHNGTEPLVWDPYFNCDGTEKTDAQDEQICTLSEMQSTRGYQVLDAYSVDITPLLNDTQETEDGSIRR